MIPAIVEKVKVKDYISFNLCLWFLISVSLYKCLLCCFYQAVRSSMYGRPGACYIDIPGNMVNAKVDRKTVRWLQRCLLCDLLFTYCINTCDWKESWCSGIVGSITVPPLKCLLFDTELRCLCGVSHMFGFPLGSLVFLPSPKTF